VKIRPVLLSATMALSCVAALIAGTAAPAQAHVGARSCTAGTPSNAPPTVEYYDPDHPEFGPLHLPLRKPVGPLLVGYHRFGTMTEEEFAATYRSGSSWIYPPDNGFLLLHGHPVEYTQTLRAGTEIDRFGYPGGSFLSPTGTRFGMRALPPQNLNTPVDTPEANYHEYCVLKAFPVDAGPIAPWFAQPGLGTQYMLDASLIPASGGAISVTWLLSNGYLVEEDPTA
jgi:hypothetical protein